jgi:putative transposase
LQKCYGRKILDLSFSNFLKILKNYEDKNGSKIIYIDRFYPSSKICYHCKKINENLNLKDRIWICPMDGKKARSLTENIIPKLKRWQK